MKLAVRDSNITSNGNIGMKSQMTIAMTPKMFRTLSDSLYSDKIGSIVRELSSNAADAHIKAGTPYLPFEIHLPNSLEPWFSVKDNGVGISPENMDTIYAQYGASTKELSNDEVGAFGLGSKTPFAYTDQFVVESIYNGVKRGYVAIIADSINLQSEEKTDEHDGVTVTLAVNNEDFHAFNNAIVRQLRFFKVKPKLVNNMRHIEVPDITQHNDIALSNDMATIFNSRGILDGLWAVQGGVGYPIDLDQLNGMTDNENVFARELEHCSGFMNFPIGSIEVIPSREGISYTPEVIKTIIERLAVVGDLITTDAMKAIQSEPTLWGRVGVYNAQLVVVQHAVRQLPSFEKLFPSDLVNGDIYRKGWRNLLAISKGPITDEGYGVTFASSRYTNKVNRAYIRDPLDYNNGVYLHVQPELQVFVRDTNSKPMQRLAHYLTDLSNAVLLVEYSDGDADIPTIAKALSIDPAKIRKISDLPVPDAPPRGARGPASKGFRWPRSSSIPYSSRQWCDVSDLSTLDDGTIWMEMDRHNFLISAARNVDWRRLMKAIIAGHITADLICVNRATAKRIRKGNIGENLVEWVDAFDELSKSIEPLTKMVINLHTLLGYRDAVSNSTAKRVLSSNGMLVPFVEKSKIATRRINILRNRLRNYKWLCDTLDINSYEVTGGVVARERDAEVCAKYPMLNMISSYHKSDDEIQVIHDYVKMVDQMG